MGLILLDLHPDSLLWVAILGLVNSLVSMCLGASVGAYLDRWSPGLPCHFCGLALQSWLVQLLTASAEAPRKQAPWSACTQH